MSGSASATATPVAAALTAATRTLTPGSTSPRLDAELLLAHVLGVDRTRLFIEARAPVEAEAARRFDALVARRDAGEPVAYLVGARAFRTLRLAVDRRVLVPRPETEELVQAALDELAHGASVIDVGTGSGAIALSLAAERPDLKVRGVDVSAEALEVARANAHTLGLDVSFSQADLLDGVAPADAVIANLPYVADAAPLPRDVADHEPALALFGGADGLAALRRLTATLATGDGRPGWVGLEIGETQGPAVRSLVTAAGFDAVEVRADLSGRDRIVIGRRPGPARTS